MVLPAIAAVVQTMAFTGDGQGQNLLASEAIGFIALPGNAAGTAALASSVASIITLNIETTSATRVAALSASVLSLDLETITAIGQIAGSAEDGQLGLSAEIIALRAPPSGRRLAPPGAAPGTDQGGLVTGTLRSGRVLAHQDGTLTPSARGGAIQTATRSGRLIRG